MPTVNLVGTISEEGGGLLGATRYRDWLLERGQRIEQMVVAEPTMCAPVHGHKGGVGLDVTVHGHAAHSSKPHLGANALSGAARIVIAIDAEQERLAALEAYEQAGIGPEDISVAEVHDATAVGEVIQIENLGFVEFGEGGPASLRGETKIGGRIPVNPSGGLESKGHPVGATGIGQVFELVTQLRGEAGARQVEGAKNAIAENGGGLHGVEEAAACVTILGR